MARRRRVIRFIPIFLILTILSCRKQAEEVQPRMPPMVDEYICRNELARNEISSYGTITYISKADVVPMTAETIKELYFEEGDIVRKGDVLAQLDTRKLEFQLEETKAGIDTKEAALVLAGQKLEESRRNMEAQFHTIKSSELDLEQKKADYERMLSILDNKKQLFEAGGITQEELLSAELTTREKETAFKQARYSLSIKSIGFREEDLIRGGFDIPLDAGALKALYIELNTRVQAAEAELARSEWLAALSRIETLKLYMEECRIKAPISGVVARKYMNPGEKAQENQPLYLIYPTDRVYALLQLSEKDLVSVKTGQKVFVSCDNDSTEYSGRIHKISPWIQKESRSGEVKVLLDNRQDQYKIGQFVRLRIQLETPAERLLIPSDSLTGEEEDCVLLIRQNRLFEKKVATGSESDGKIPVLEGLSEGDRIVSRPSDSLKDGMEVRIR